MIKPQIFLPTGGAWDTVISLLNVWKRIHYFPNYMKPKTFNEYFLQEKIHFTGDLDLAKKLTDKIEIKSWLTAHGLGEYVIPTYFSTDNIDELSAVKLPSPCIIKPSHSSGHFLIFNKMNDTCLGIDELKYVKNWLMEDYYKRGREPNYKDLPRKIIVEELLVDDNGTPPKDYKVQCVLGVPCIIQVDIDRFNNHTRQLYTPDWQLLPYCTSYPLHPVPETPPRQLEKALEIARFLSGPFKLCRIDLYFLRESEIRIGEVTFFPANCAEIFEPRSGDMEAGKLIDKILKQQS